MKITVDTDAKTRLEALVDFIAKRAEDKAHENNGDAIAEFLDKFMVVELKRLENKPETIPEDLEIPDKVLAEPLNKMKAALDGAFDNFMNGKGIPKSGKSTPPPAVQTEEEETQFQATNTATQKTPRQGNGHKTGIKRKLNNTEKDFIRDEFKGLNGEFEDSKKSCTAMLPSMGTEVTVWQITGFVSYLHREIAANRFTVPDMDSYMKFLKAHKKLWAQYNSDKYKKLRGSTMNTTPKFNKGTFKQKTA